MYILVDVHDALTPQENRILEVYHQRFLQNTEPAGVITYTQIYAAASTRREAIAPWLSVAIWSMSRCRSPRDGLYSEETLHKFRHTRSHADQPRAKAEQHPEGPNSHTGGSNHITCRRKVLAFRRTHAWPTPPPPFSSAALLQRTEP